MSTHRRPRGERPTLSSIDAMSIPGFYLTKRDKLVDGKVLASYQGIQHDVSFGGRDEYRRNETNISVRNQFSRTDYEYFRPDETVPKKQKEIISYCMTAYDKVGIIRNVIDLMADFAGQGIQINHPNPRIQKFLRGWFHKINGKERSERFLNLLYRTGNVIVRRSMMKVPVRDEAEFRSQGAETLEPDMDMESPLRPLKRVIPGRYDFLSPLAVEAVGGELALFSGEQVYALKINHALKQKVLYPKNEVERQIVAKLPSEVVAAIKNGTNFLPLDKNKISVSFYKKDDWLIWANPMIYSILDDLIMLEKMKLADLAALDGAISQIRLWKLGDLKSELFPNDAAVAKLAEILLSNTGGGAFDLIWGPDLELIETSTDVHQFLGAGKYEPVLQNIFAGLGIPPTLTGSSNASGFTNNFIAIQTLVQRLEYGRMVLAAFWRNELELIRKAYGFRQRANVTFDHQVLNDASSLRALLLQAVDRDLLSEETFVERFGEDPELELVRRKREHRMRESNQLPDKVSPYHTADKTFELLKIALQRGLITPGEANLTDELGERRPGEKTSEEQMVELKKAQGPAVSKKPSGQPQQGRPKNSGDSTKRKSKSVKPRTSASLDETFESLDRAEDFISKSLWAKAAYADLSNILSSAFLQHFNKTDIRSLSASEFAEVEKTKFAILLQLEPYSKVDGVHISEILNSGKLSVPASAKQLYNKMVAHIVEKTGKEPTIEEMRNVRCAVYALLKE